MEEIYTFNINNHHQNYTGNNNHLYYLLTANNTSDVFRVVTNTYVCLYV